MFYSAMVWNVVKNQTRSTAGGLVFVFAAATTGVGLLALYHLDRSAGARSPGLDWLLASGLLGDARDQIIAACAASGALAVVGSFWCAAFITRPITKISRQLLELGNGNLDVRPSGIDRSDEVGQLAQAFVLFEQKLRGTRELERRNAEQETRARDDELQRQAAELQHARSNEARAEQLETLVLTFETSVEQALAALHQSGAELKRTAETMAATVEATRERASIVSSASRLVTENVKAVATAAAELSESTSQIHKQIVASKVISEEA